MYTRVVAMEHRYKGIARNGKIELEGGVKVPEGAEVIVLFEGAQTNKKADASKWAESMRIIESFRGKLPILPEDAYSTEALYP